MELISQLIDGKVRLGKVVFNLLFQMEGAGGFGCPLFPEEIGQILDISLDGLGIFPIGTTAAEVQRFKIQIAVGLEPDIGMFHGIGDGGQQIDENAVREEIWNLLVHGFRAVYDMEQFPDTAVCLFKLIILQGGGELAHRVVGIGQGRAAGQEGRGLPVGYHRALIPEAAGLNGLLIQRRNIQRRF